MKAIVLCGLLVASGSSGFATESGRQVLPGHVPAAVAQLQPLGRLPASNHLSLAIGLPLRHTNELAALLQALYDPASLHYHHYLTAPQFAEQFGPSEEDYKAVLAFATNHGLAVKATYPNRVLLDVDGRVDQIENIFQIELHTYQHPRESRTFYAPSSGPSLETALPVLHIGGLDNLIAPRPLIVQGAGEQAPGTGSGPGGSYIGNDFRAAYVPGLALNGAGQTVGLFEVNSGFYTNDIANYESLAGLPNVPVNTVLVDGYNGNPGGSNEEVSLDIELSISMAPGLAQVLVYEGSYPDDILNRMAADNSARQIGSSWLYGIDATTEQIFQEFGAQGQSFFNASGDGGAWVGAVATPADDPYVTIVGGTVLTTTGLGGAWVAEQAWNSTTDMGTGGGISTVYSIPSWQQGIGMVTNAGSTTMRNLPDVALTAANIYVTHGSNRAGIFSGTSCATPLWAGYLALANQQAAALGRSPLGFINPAIYGLGKEGAYTEAFHDIVTGNNTNSGSPNLFYAVPGYDLCTGWGTPNGSNLINALVLPNDALEISPGLGFAASGPSGGAFNPASQVYSLKNTGASVVSWTLSNTSTWLTASASSGQLKAGGGFLETVSLAPSAASLPVGTYTTTLWFTNSNDGFGQSRQFVLQVTNFPPVITSQPASLSVSTGSTAVFDVTGTGTALHYFWQKNGHALTNSAHISGSATPTLTISNVATSDAAVYSVLVSNFLGNALSSGASLAVDTVGSGQLIQNGGFEIGDFSDWTQSGNTNFTSVATNGVAVHSGRFGAQFGPGGSLGFISQRVPTTAGGLYLLSAWVDSPDGQGPDRFQVSWNGNVILDASGLGAVGWSNLQFVVSASGPSSVVEFGFRDDPSYLGLDDVTLTPLNEASPPVITQQPQSQSAVPGGSATFSVTASGTAPLAYAWLMNGLPIPGATGSTYTIANATSFAGSQFSCLVSNLYGAVTSSAAALIVAGPVYAFNGADGGGPFGGLTRGIDGNYYGTTEYSGAFGYGTVFRLATNGILTSLVSFTDTNGAFPMGKLLSASDGNLYGTAESGTNGNGVVFRLSTNGTVTPLHWFESDIDGNSPYAGLIQSADGALYGTTENGGTNDGYGTVYRITTNGVFTVIFTFDYTNGAFVEGALIQGQDGALYGTTEGGGLNDNGTVFRLTTNGAQTTLVAFSRSTSGESPGYPGGSALVQGLDGAFYGTAEEGGVFSYGTVFRVTTNGALSAIYSFSGPDGSYPHGTLALASDGSFYGTCGYGGTSSSSVGTLFRLTTNGNLTTLLSFDGTNGAEPYSGPLLGSDGNLYGTTFGGGLGFNGYAYSGDGVVYCLELASLNIPLALISQPASSIVSQGGMATFSVTANGSSPLSYSWRRNGTTIAGATAASYTTNNVQVSDSGVQFSCLVSNASGALLSSNATLTVVAETASGAIYQFKGAEGGYPFGLIVGMDGAFYGTTEYGGADGYGTVFRVTPNGTLSTVCSFTYASGAYPYAGVIQGADGNFYGTTTYGGAFDDGTVFQVSSNGALTVLASFDNSIGFDLNQVQGSLVQGADGSFYGTTSEGGEFDGGTVFQVTTAGVLNLLFTFDGTNGSLPFGLVQGPNGLLYGTTSGGGAYGYGTIFRLGTNGGAFTNLFSFSFDTNGAYPGGPLVLGADGSIYGTAEEGGTGGDGTVFRVTTNGTVTALASFDGYDNGAYPEGPLMQGADGALYGTTEFGGGADYLEGTVFRATTNGVITLLFSPNSTNGAYPVGGVVQGSDGNFYGCAIEGGAFFDGNYDPSNGTVFRVANLSPPIIVEPPESISAYVGTTVVFSVDAEGTPPLSYLWQRNGVPISGAGSIASYTTNNVQLADSGAQFSCVVSNAYGSVTSSVAVLTVDSLVLNGGFETGSFLDWATNGNFMDSLISTNALYAHSGAYGAQLGPATTLGYLSQTVPTANARAYLLSFWVDSPNGDTPNEFLMSWGGVTLMDNVNMGATGWTNCQFVVAPAGPTTVLEFGFRDDPSYLGLDDISVVPLPELEFESAKRSNSSFTFAWASVPGLIYQVQYKTNLHQATWRNLGAPITAVGPTTSISDTIGPDPARYYRVHSYAP